MTDIQKIREALSELRDAFLKMNGCYPPKHGQDSYKYEAMKKADEALSLLPQPPSAGSVAEAVREYEIAKVMHDKNYETASGGRKGIPQGVVFFELRHIEALITAATAKEVPSVTVEEMLERSERQAKIIEDGKSGWGATNAALFALHFYAKKISDEYWQQQANEDWTGFEGNLMNGLDSALAACKTQSLFGFCTAQEEWDTFTEALLGAAGILDVVKGEWAEAWSDYDQGVREKITKCLQRMYAIQDSLKIIAEKGGEE
jgi:hypothetical protein